MKASNTRWLSLFTVVSAVAVPALVWASPQLIFTVQNGEVGGMNQKVVLPYVADVPTGNIGVRVQGLMSQLNMVRPDLYQNVQINVDPGFSQNGKVVVETGMLEGENLTQVLSELFYSLSALGMKDMFVPALGGEKFEASAIPYPVAQITVPAWKALPPVKFSGVLIQVSGKVLMPAEDFYAGLASKDALIGTELAKGLSGTNPRMRATTAESLGLLNVSNPAELLIPLTKDGDREVRIAAVKALDTHRSNPAVQTALENVVQKDTESAVKAAAVQVLVAAGRAEFQVFMYIEKLSDPNPATVIEAVRKLAQANNPAASASLVDVLLHPAVEVRDEAINGLIAGKNGEGMRRALTLQGVADDVKLRLAKGMTGQEDNATIDAGLSYIVVAGEPADSRRAAEALGTRKSTQGLSSLIEGLNHPDQGVKTSCANAIGAVGDPSGLEALADLKSRSGDSPVGESARNGAVTLLKSLSLDQVIDFSNHPNAVIRRFALESLGAFAQGGRNQKVVQELRNKLMDSDTQIREAAAVSLSEIEDPAIATQFAGMMGDSNDVIRSRVAVTLGWSRDASAGMKLIEMLQDSSSLVKLESARSISRRKDNAALPELLKFVTYGKPEVRIAVMEAVLAVSTAADNEKLMPVFQNALYDSEEAVKLVAVQGMARNLQTQSAPVAISNLASVIIDPSEKLQLEVVKFLGTAKDPTATEPLARALFSDYRAVKEAALDAMLENGQDNADKPLQEFIRNEQNPELLKKANGVYDALGL